MKIRKLAAVLAVPLLMAAGTAMAEGPMPPAQGYGIGDRMPLFPGVGPDLGDGTGKSSLSATLSLVDDARTGWGSLRSPQPVLLQANLIPLRHAFTVSCMSIRAPVIRRSE